MRTLVSDMIEGITIGVTTVAFSKNKVLVESLRSFGFKEVKINEAGKRFSKLELVEFLKDCQGAIIGLDEIDADVLNQVTGLKIISKYGVGLDNIDLVACERNSVQVLHTQGVNKRSVSEMALGFMLSLSRNLYFASNQLKAGTWNKDGGSQLSEKTVGIIGVGHVGKDLIELLKPFNCKILVNDIINQEEYYQEKGLTEQSKEAIFSASDIITVHTPLTEKTSNLLNKAAFTKMKNSAFIINTARGGIINQEDLKFALKHKEIAGAAIDAYVVEPPEDSELIELPNLINTPHIGGNTEEAVNAMGEVAIKNIVTFYS